MGKGILLVDEWAENVPGHARGNAASRQRAGQGEGGLRGQQGRTLGSRDQSGQHSKWKGETKGAKALKIKAKNRNVSKECE